MADTRSHEEIENRAKVLYATWLAPHEKRLPTRVNHLWGMLNDGQQEGWFRLARAIPGVIHHEESTSGGFPTANQADRIRELREKYLQDPGRERSFIGSATRPYGDMILIFESPGKAENWRTMAWLIHPDGQCEELHHSRVSK